VLALGAGDFLPLFGAGLVVVGDLADGVGVEEEQAGEAVLVAVDLGGRGVAQDGQDLGPARVEVGPSRPS